MKSSQSKFSREKSQSSASSSSKSGSGKPSGCCCGSKISDDIDEVEVIDVEGK